MVVGPILQGFWGKLGYLAPWPGLVWCSFSSVSPRVSFIASAMMSFLSVTPFWPVTHLHNVVSLPPPLSVSLSIYPSIYLSIYSSIYLYLSIYLFYLTTFQYSKVSLMSTYLFIYLFFFFTVPINIISKYFSHIDWKSMLVLFFHLYNLLVTICWYLSLDHFP